MVGTLNLLTDVPQLIVSFGTLLVSILKFVPEPA